jgi:hypothetical protein
MEREMTNSITHLVKIVSREVAQEEIKKATHFTTEAIKSVSREHLENLTSSLAKAGDTWEDEEKELFIQEVKTAIAQIAVNHKRSRGAIHAALKKSIIEGGL